MDVIYNHMFIQSETALSQFTPKSQCLVKFMSAYGCDFKNIHKETKYILVKGWLYSAMANLGI